MNWLHSLEQETNFFLFLFFQLPCHFLFVFFQLQHSNPSFIGGLYNQYIQHQLNSSNSDKIDESGDNKSNDIHSNQTNESMENNLMLQINADKHSSTPSATNNEILQQLYNYSQMSGELIK